MKVIQILSTVACTTVFMAGGAIAELEGIQPGTSSNPKDNVPEKIQRSTLGEAAYPEGSSGPGTRSDKLVDMKKEKSEPVTLDDLKKDVQQTHGGASAVAAEKLQEDSMRGAKTDKAHRQSETSATGSTGPKKDAEASRQLHSDKTVQGQDLVNEQPMDKQQPANRPAHERGAR